MNPEQIIYDRDSTALADWLRHGGVNYAQPSNGRTLIHIACGANWMFAVNELLQRGADPFIEDHKGHTTLHSALESCRSRVLQLLVERDLDRVVDLIGNSASALFFKLCETRESTLCRVSLEEMQMLRSFIVSVVEADPTVHEITSDFGEKPLHAATSAGNDLAVEALLTTRAGRELVDQRSERNETALMVAARGNSRRVIDALLDGGAGPLASHTVWARHAVTPFFVAAANHEACAFWRMYFRLDSLGGTDSHANNVLHYAYTHGYPTLETIELEYSSIDTEQKNSRGLRPREVKSEWDL